MKCPACGRDLTGGVGVKCARCGYLAPGVGVTPQEVVVRISTGIHRNPDEHWRRRVPRIVKILYGLGALAWLIPIGLALHYRASPMPESTGGWRVLGMLLAIALAAILLSLCWAGAFFYGRLVTADQIADEAERGTGKGVAHP